MNLEKLKVAELSAQEVHETEGGIWPVIVLGVIIYLASTENDY